jgi:hypothetical protein
VSIGKFTERVTTDEAWPVDFAISQIVPPHYPPE